MKKICVLGLGYIGLPTAATLASKGFTVYGVDIKEDVVRSLKMGQPHIEEPHLSQLVQETVAKGNLIPVSMPKEADVFIIAVPTPKTQENECELNYVMEAARSILPYLRVGNTIILESTVTPGTTEDVIKTLVEENGLIVGQDIYLAHCPERVLPGRILHEIIYNNRIIGGYTETCAIKAKEIYDSFVLGQIFATDLKTAEMAKLVENIFRDVNIAFANELVKVCDEMDIDAIKVIELANKHPRVNILQPGPGVGGHCLAIDPYYVISKVPQQAKLMATAREINCSMPNYVAAKVEQVLEGIKNPKVAVFGITYKENVDDVRESPSLEIIGLLKQKDIVVTAFDPHVMDERYQLTDADTAVKDADMIVISVAHDEFKTLDYNLLSQKMRNPIIYDAKNILEDSKYPNTTILYMGRVF